MHNLNAAFCPIDRVHRCRSCPHVSLYNWLQRCRQPSIHASPNPVAFLVHSINRPSLAAYNAFAFPWPACDQYPAASPNGLASGLPSRPYPRRRQQLHSGIRSPQRLPWSAAASSTASLAVLATPQVGTGPIKSVSHASSVEGTRSTPQYTAYTTSTRPTRRLPRTHSATTPRWPTKLRLKQRLALSRAA